MKKKVAYIVGKISGLPIEEAKQNFDIKRKHLEANGYDVLDPFEAYETVLEEFGAPKPEAGSQDEWNMAMRASIFHMTSAGFMPGYELEIHPLPNYRDSKGAAIEIDLAEKLGIKVVYPRFTVRPKATFSTENVQK